MMNHAYSDTTNKPEDMICYFDLHDIQVVKEIDECHRIIKFTAKRKYSDSQSESKNHLMLVSYQVIDKERATISMFEFDEKRQYINPLNFFIVSHNIEKIKLL